MFLKSSIYKPYGKCKNSSFRPSLYDDEMSNPFEEIDAPQEYLNFLKDQNAHLYDTIDSEEDIAKDDILEYILREYP